MIQAFSTNPMERRLVHESKTPLDEAKGISSVTDSKGDTWKRRTGLVRNSTHPHYIKPDKQHISVGISSHANVWHNQRTGEVHEGSVRVYTDGKASIGDGYDSNPRFFHISHYEQGKPVKEETEQVEEGWAEKSVSRIFKYKQGQYSGHGSRGPSYRGSINLDPKSGNPAGPEDRAMLAIAQMKGPTRLKYRASPNKNRTWGDNQKSGAAGADIYKK